MNWIERNAAKLLAGAALIALVCAILTMTMCSQARNAKTEAKVSSGQAGAAIDSGKDASNTVGNRMEAEAGSDQLTGTNGDEIRKADGASAPVAAPVRDAGLDSLCRRRAYSGSPKCVLRPNSR